MSIVIPLSSALAELCASALAPGAGDPGFWQLITRAGDSRVLLPLSAGLLAALAVRAGRWGGAAAALAALATAAVLTLGSKLIFLGYGVGHAALDFTGISGHAMCAAFAYPLFARAAAASWRPGARAALVAGAHGLAMLLAYSRIEVQAHSASEVIAGYALGAAAGWAATVALQAPRVRFPLAPVGLLALVLAATLGGGGVPASHDLVTRVALEVSGRSTPYTRADLQRTRRLERWLRTPRPPAHLAAQPLGAL